MRMRSVSLLGQLQERAPVGSVVDVVRVRIVGIDLEAADFVEAKCGGRSTASPRSVAINRSRL